MGSIRVAWWNLQRVAEVEGDGVFGRTKGKWRSEPLRIAPAENVAFLVRDHVRFDAQR